MFLRSFMDSNPDVIEAFLGRKRHIEDFSSVLTLFCFSSIDAGLQRWTLCGLDTHV